MNDNDYWQAILNRDEQYDGQFVYAVRTTGIYCHPSCHSRRPRRENVRFFARSADAEAAGYRPCRRCHPNKATASNPHIELVEDVCRYLDQSHEHTPTLRDLSEQFHLSPYHLQRTFKHIVGITPRQYMAAQRRERFKEHLKGGMSVTEALYEAGYQSTSTAYGRAAQGLGMTPLSYQQGGQAKRITFASAPCSLGWLLVAGTDRGVCAVRIGDSEAELEAALHDEFPAATVQRSDGPLTQWLHALLNYLSGAQTMLDLPLDIQATAFQQQVYDALRTIPYGSTRSYSEVAAAIGQPTAVRAVARACAMNPVALIVPCHRVVQADGRPGGYRWGVERKQALLDQERRK